MQPGSPAFRLGGLVNKVRADDFIGLLSPSGKKKKNPLVRIVTKTGNVSSQKSESTPGHLSTECCWLEGLSRRTQYLFCRIVSLYKSSVPRVRISIRPVPKHTTSTIVKYQISMFKKIFDKHHLLCLLLSPRSPPACFSSSSSCFANLGHSLDFILTMCFHSHPSPPQKRFSVGCSSPSMRQT